MKALIVMKWMYFKRIITKPWGTVFMHEGVRVSRFRCIILGWRELDRMFHERN